VDGLHNFLDTYDRLDGGAWVDALAQLLADGRAVGLHFVVAADRRSGIPMRFTTQFGSTLILRLATPDEYLAVGIPPTFLGKEPPAGRGILDGYEVQVGILGGQGSGDAQAEAIRNLAQVGPTYTENPAPEIRRLPFDVALSSLPVGSIGVSGTTLQPVPMPDTRAFGVLGPPRSGRSTALGTIAFTVRRAEPQRPILIATTRGPTSILNSINAQTATGSDEATRLVDALIDRLNALPSWNPLLLIDDLTELIDPPLDAALERLLTMPRDVAYLFAAVGEASALRQAYSGCLSQLRKARTGILLMPDVATDGDVFNLTLPRTHTSPHQGRGFVITGSDITPIQLAHPD
jgi:S-DNA-T family DNA segregation ATPase FtsK/SpoIIIE